MICEKHEVSMSRKAMYDCYETYLESDDSCFQIAGERRRSWKIANAGLNERTKEAVVEQNSIVSSIHNVLQRHKAKRDTNSNGSILQKHQKGSRRSQE